MNGQYGQEKKTPLTLRICYKKKKLTGNFVTQYTFFFAATVADIVEYNRGNCWKYEQRNWNKLVFKNLEAVNIERKNSKLFISITCMV